MIHGKGLATVAGSAEFLISYANSLNVANGANEAEPSIKGKEIVDQNDMAGSRTHEPNREAMVTDQSWSPPPPGWVKLSTDTECR
jgi:hypothetical protein